jgi:hypothetical protein
VTNIYLIGSLRNPTIPTIGNALRDEGFEVFDDWFAGGKIADDEWQAYEKAKGNTYEQALAGYAAKHVYEFDLHHLKRADVGLLVMPAGKSGHLELGYLAGQGKPTFVYFPEGEPERWDVMYQFCTGYAFDMPTLLRRLPHEKVPRPGDVIYGPAGGNIYYDERDQIFRSRCDNKETKDGYFTTSWREKGSET